MKPDSTGGDDNDDRTTSIDSSGNTYPKTPQERSSCLSEITFSWLSPLYSTGYKRTLQMEDLNYLKG